MATYVILNLVFIAVVCAVVKLRIRRPRLPWVMTLTALIILTAIFDNLIVGFDIVGYDPSKILGVFVGVAPVEDFMYAILAALLIPVAWNKLGVKNHANT